MDLRKKENNSIIIPDKNALFIMNVLIFNLGHSFFIASIELIPSNSKMKIRGKISSLFTSWIEAEVYSNIPQIKL